MIDDSGQEHGETHELRLLRVYRQLRKELHALGVQFIRFTTLRHDREDFTTLAIRIVVKEDGQEVRYDLGGEFGYTLGSHASEEWLLRELRFGLLHFAQSRAVMHEESVKKYRTSQERLNTTIREGLRD